MRNEIIKDDLEAKIKLEYTEDSVFIHLDLFVWSRDILRRIDKELLEIGKTLKEKGYEFLYTYNRKEDEKWVRFVTLVGFDFAFLLENKSIFVYDLRGI
ncbi:hypothetical protein [Caudoviricetes sp.]|nr:hypothetical protein [Caudoviricetes sp.]